MEHGWPAARVLEYLKTDMVDVFKLYAPAYGGLRQAQQLMGMIAAAGKDAYVGSDVEMGIATLAFGHLAAASPECRITEWPCDLRGPRLLVDDVLDPPVRYDSGGRLVLTPGPGLGVSLNRDGLERLRGDLDSPEELESAAPVGGAR
jgi:L-alanine-DL-glutamate epimerase-like enolase superfamily enzyme